MSRAATKRRKPRRRRARWTARDQRNLDAVVTIFCSLVDRIFGPPLLRYSGFPETEPELQPATFRVVEPKRLPAPMETA